MSELTHDDVQTILRIIDEMGDRDISIEIGELKLQVTRGTDRLPAPAAPRAPEPPPTSARQMPAAAETRPAPTPAQQAASKPKAVVPAGHVAVTAPTSGTFYRAPSPTAKPFTEVGNHVAADDIVCVFDVMKLFTSLRAGVAGTVTAILVENQAVVEQDQPLIVIKPD